MTAVPVSALDPDAFVFYTIGRWDERKAVFLAIEAYLRAFTADDPVVLVVKTGPRLEMPPGEWGAGNPLSWTTPGRSRSLVRQFRTPARVHSRSRRGPTTASPACTRRGDCYLTLARGEGWGIGAFDASAYGNPVVATGWGGFLEYLDDDERVPRRPHSSPRSSTTRSRRTPATSSGRRPTSTTRSKRARAVVADPDAARVRAGEARDRVLDRYAPARVAVTFLDVVSRHAGAFSR